ncbi:uncharacterized protein LOC141660253 [Apium graveolens]|uniref:uncharacterized protein LOC141660253 n=1 Tax=Apium graveolens TaxID=4045 RepID=UPI003D7AA830
MTTGNKFSFTDLQNPIFIHPSDGPTSISVTKLQGAANRTWRRSMEIQLASKRKLGSVEDSSAEIWKQLEKRFQLSNGSRKYKLSKDLYSLKQNGKPLVEYYTNLSALWDELEAMSDLPNISTTTDEVTTLLKAIQVQKNESRLFQFLNGLDEHFGPQRSQLLIFSALPSVEMASSVIQQEESQQDNLQNSGEEDISAMFSKGLAGVNLDKYVVCTVCKRKGHSADKCWTIVGYPKWYNKPAGRGNSAGRWNDRGGGRSGNAPWTSSVNCVGSDKRESPNAVITHQQFEQLLKLIPGNINTQTTEEDMDTPFSGMITSNAVESLVQEWIVDSGASDHMSCSLICCITLNLHHPISLLSFLLVLLLT